MQQSRNFRWIRYIRLGRKFTGGCLHDMRAFYKEDGSFDFDKLQIFSNCIMSYLGHAAHHSMLEVAEVSNRLCDLVAIDMLENSSAKK